MHVHLPKPLHGWREFLGEVGIIVLGVLIALGANALIERTNWRQKVGLADANMRVEVVHNRTNAAQYAILQPCADRILDRMTADLISGNTADLNKLHAIGEPFVSEAWTATAWEAAVAGQIGQHMDAERFLNYAEAFRRSAMMTDIQFRLRDNYAAAMVGRFGLKEPSAVPGEVTAAEMLRRDIAVAREVTRDFIRNSDDLGIGPDAAGIREYRAKARSCMAALSSPRLPPSPEQP
jgi:hypothetical protein